MSVLIVPNYTQGYDPVTGEWSIINDHDFQLHLMRSQPGDFIVVPKGINWDEMRFIEQLPWSSARHLVHIPYDPDPVQNVKFFWRRQIALNGFAQVNNLTAIVNSVPGYRGDMPLICVYNYLKNDAKPTAEDQFFEAKMADFRKCRKGLLLTQQSKDVVIEYDAELLSKVKLNQRCIDPVKWNHFQSKGKTFVRDKKWYLFPINTSTDTDEDMATPTGSGFVWWCANRTNRQSPARNCYFYGKQLSLFEHYGLFLHENLSVLINIDVRDTYDLGWAEIFYANMNITTNKTYQDHSRPAFIEVDGTEYSL
ncbi:hypothetical protein PS2_042 [Serratia phage PS2]|uniref:Uncharacterized protein n=1 Tax=Serratia phage PS2 TaxID=1481112 RepID=A0A023W6D3_9CAUD|nr:hypothetical protein FF83_gp042 [Serratia phage PS2]AHY25292.1 hypothetical protein PS2_042 [Serratia phage PS2]